MARLWQTILRILPDPCMDSYAVKHCRIVLNLSLNGYTLHIFGGLSGIRSPTWRDASFASVPHN